LRRFAATDRRGLLPAGLLAVALVFLAACTPSNVSFNGPVIPTGPAQPVTGETLGNGTIRVALLVPLSANGNAAQIALNLRNAAQLALRELPSSDILVMVKDTGGTADGAQAAAIEAISQGAELILGPLFAQEVPAAAAVARSAGVPMVAFSTDSTVAAPGVYLLSFLPRSDVQRIIPYAASHGYTAIAALLPDNAYGTVVEAALRETIGATGARLVAVQRYALDRGAMQVSAEAVADIILAGQADAVFMPDGGDATPFLAQILAAKGVDLDSIKLLGSGQWNDDRIKNESTLVGGWYPGPETAGFDSFSSRYASAYGARPPPTAGLGYDATILAAGLAATQGAARFAPSSLTNPNGFRGIDGAFRFFSDGTNQRALAVFEVSRDGARVIDPAATGFSTVVGGVFN
jgi:ABC-type branched-subunit amino acid transport system substrate-binding protein